MCRTCPLLHRTDICGVVQRLPRRVSVPQAQVRFLPPLLMKFTAMKILTLIILNKYGVNAQINENKELVLPTNNVADLNRVLEFLNEDIFRGVITDRLYRSNSKKKDNH